MPLSHHVASIPECPMGGVCGLGPATNPHVRSLRADGGIGIAHFADRVKLEK